MHNLSPLALVASLFACCGGGGGGGGAGPTPSTTIDLGSGTVQATTGQLVVVAAPSPLFAAGIDYTAQWTANGTPVGTARVRAISPESLALLVPTLADGSYEARVTLPSFVARTRFSVTASPPPANAAATITAAHAALAARATALRTEANTEPDAAVRAARLADLGRADQAVAGLAAALATASPADQFLAATVFEQNPLLRGQVPVIAFDAGDRFASIGADLLVARAMAPQGVAAVSIGLAPGLPTLVAAALTAGGLVTVAHALPSVRSAVRRPFRPVDGFVVQLAPGASSVVVQPTLNLVSGAAATIVGYANFGSLAQVDRTLGSAVLSSVLADLDAVLAVFASPAQAVAALIENRPDDVPAQRVVERALVAPQEISIEAQSQLLVSMTLTLDQLVATSFAGATPVTTVGLFRYETGAQGFLTTPVTVNVTP